MNLIPPYALTRRTLLKRFGSLAAGTVWNPGRMPWDLATTKSARSSWTPATSPCKSRAPLTASEFSLLPLGSIRPRGWLLTQLHIQAAGLGGHLDEVWPDVGPESGWLGGKGESWERGPYFLDGLVPLAYALDNQILKAKAQRFIDWTLRNQSPDGMIGPPANDDWWPRMVMLKVLTQYYEATADPRVIPALSRYFAHRLKQAASRPLESWGKYRWQDEIVSIVWLYNRTEDRTLIQLAYLLKKQGYDWKAQFSNFQFKQPCTAAWLGLKHAGDNNDRAMQSHGVNNAMALKASPVWSLVSGAEADRSAIHLQLAELVRYHGLPNGTFSADEHFAGRNPSQGTELCTVVEMMYSLEVALAILGEASLGDQLERIAFNALPGAFIDDMWAHQYNQQPNQVEVSVHTKPWTTDGPESNIYGLAPNFGCCTANFHQGWPKFTASLVMMSQDDGIVAAAYSPCEVRTQIRDVRVHLLEETDYPFTGSVRFTVHPASPIMFPFRLRIPEWAHATTIKVNGRLQDAPAPGAFAVLSRTWSAGDVVELHFPLSPRTSTGYNNSVVVERGPLVFSLDIKGDWVKLRDRRSASDWQVYPAAAWNYALDLQTSKSGEVIRTVESPVTDGPFTSAHAPVVLHVKGRRVPDWRAEDGVTTPVPQSPLQSDQPLETLRLVPYGAAKLRITTFPLIGRTSA